MPIHLRAAEGDYADACLLPGDPERARRLAERFLQDAREVTRERGLLGYTGTFGGERVSIQSTGMGCPSAAIVVEELVRLGVRRLLRVGTCGALRPELPLGDLVLALAATPIDRTALRYTGGEPHAPTADWDLLHGVVHAAKGLGLRPHVGAIVSADAFYEPDPDAFSRWSARGHLAVEMEASAIFTLAALRGVAAGCLLVVSDQLTGDTPVRIEDDALAEAVDRMAELALTAVVRGA